MKRFSHWAALGLALGLAPAAVAQLTSFGVIDYPGSIRTFANGINDAGDIVGMYYSPDQKRHGFLLRGLRGGQFTMIEFPGATDTWAWDINRAGDIVGSYLDPGGKQHAYLLSGGRFTTIDFPGADMTTPGGINAKGEMVGMYWNLSGDTKMRGFLFSGGRFTSFEYPAPNLMSCFFSINDEGDMVGHWQDTTGVAHGWLMRQGKSSSVDVPGAQHTMMDRGGITAAGDLLGSYTDPRGKTKAFLWSKDRFTPFDVPGSRAAHAFRMNASGQIVGHYVDANGVAHGFVTSVAPRSRSQLLTVDDDGADCPGGLATIQEAVAQAPAGATILVCPGIYFKSVTIAGPEKNGLKLIAQGRENEVVLQGDYTERDGFHLENVSNVLIRGFTVRDFGNKPTTPSEWGAGNQIYLMNAHYNTIEHNTLVNGDMMGIMLTDSGNNTVQQNVAFVDNANLANCGIHVAGAKSAQNVFRQNMTYGNNFAGIMIRGAGPGNYVMDNTVVSNGRFGIDVENTNEIWIEGNRVSYNRGFWGTTPGGKDPGVGIYLVNVNKATVFDNRLRNNTGGDLSWDGKGENKLESNACDSSTPAGACGR